MELKPSQIASGEVLIYEYGVRIDRESRAAIDDQITHARRLYNELVAQIRRIVTEMNAYVLESAGEPAKSLHARIEQLNAELDAARSGNDATVMKTIASERRRVWRELNAALADTRKRLRDELRTRFLTRIGKNTRCDTYRLRSEAVGNGLGWATANAVLDSALQAFNKSIQKGQPPCFTTGADKTQDTLTLQFTDAGGVAATRLLEGKHPEIALLPNNGCGRRKYGQFRFRLGLAKAETYATGTWQYHRPLPEGAQVALARLVRRRIGKDYKWAVQLMVRQPEPASAALQGRKALATVHFGWSGDANGRRVAAIADSADPRTAWLVHLPSPIETMLERSIALQSERDRSRDDIVPRVKAIEPPGTWGEELRGEFASLRQLQVRQVAQNRLHRFCRLLSETEAIPDWLEAWRKTDRQRWQSAAHIARRARNRRREFYRQIAVELARNYDAIVMEPLDLAKMAQKVDETTGERQGLSRKARTGRTIAALYEFEAAIRGAATKAQVAILELVGRTASSCALCGGQVLPDAQDPQFVHCSICNADLERKTNAATVAWQEASAQRESAVTEFWIASRMAREQQSAKKADRLSRMTDARRRTQTASSDGSE